MVWVFEYIVILARFRDDYKEKFALILRYAPVVGVVVVFLVLHRGLRMSMGRSGDWVSDRLNLVHKMRPSYMIT